MCIVFLNLSFLAPLKNPVATLFTHLSYNKFCIHFFSSFLNMINDYTSTMYSPYRNNIFNFTCIHKYTKRLAGKFEQRTYYSLQRVEHENLNHFTCYIIVNSIMPPVVALTYSFIAFEAMQFLEYDLC